MSKKLNKNVPKLRFSKFMDDWEKLTLSSLVENIIDYRGKAPPKSEDGIILITARNVKQGFLDFTSKEFISSEDYADWMNRGLPQKGDILFTTEAPLGNVCMFPDSGIYALGQRTLTLRSKSGLSYGEFLFYILQSPKIRAEIFSKSTGSTAKGIKSSVFKKIPLKVPSVEEQEMIASFLRAIATRLTQLRRKHELLQTYKRGVMQKIFSQEVRFRDEIGSEYPNWEKKKLKSIAEINPSSNYFPDQFLYIDLESVNNGILSAPELLSKENSPSRAQRVLQKGDILYQTVRPYQRNNLFFNLDGDYIASTGYAQLRAKENQRFLYQLIYSDSFVDKVVSRCTGTSYPAINSSDLANISVFIQSSIKEQEKIAKFLIVINQKIDMIGRQIESIEQFRKGLLQKMFV
jgi:type I restriction enzyme, S subunit